MKFLLILSLFLSCASTWKPERVEFKKERWNICTEELNGEEYALKGFCYRRKYIKKRFLIPDLIKIKTEFVSFDDKEGLKRFINAGKYMH